MNLKSLLYIFLVISISSPVLAYQNNTCYDVPDATYIYNISYAKHMGLYDRDKQLCVGDNESHYKYEYRLCNDLWVYSQTLSGRYRPDIDQTMFTASCRKLMNFNTKYRLDPYVILATALAESRMDPSDRTGCCYGLMQINPYYYCPNRNEKGCNLIGAGLNALYMNYATYEDPILAHSAYICGLTNMYNEVCLSYARSRLNLADLIRENISYPI